MAYLLFLILSCTLVRSDTVAVVAATSDGERLRTVTAQTDSARLALEQGRFFRASLLYRERIREHGDTSPATMLLAARAAAGWGDWEGVERLLARRSWLDEQPQAWAVLGEARYALEQWTATADALRRALAPGASLDSRDAALAQARLAHALGQLGDHDAASAAFDDAIARLPALRDWLNVFAASAAGQVGDVRGADARLAAIDVELAREWGWRAAVTARVVVGDTAAAIESAERAAASIELPARKAEAWQHAAALRRARGDAAGARAAFRRAVDAAPGSAAARTAARALADMGSLAGDERLLVGRTLIRHGDFEQGTPLLRAHLGSLGRSAAADALRLEVGDALFRGRQHRDAESILIDLAASSSDRARAATAHFIAGRAQYRDGRQSAGRATFEQVAQRYAGEAGAVQAAYFAADLLHDDEEYGRARALYRRAVDAGRGDVEEVGLAAMRLAGMAWAEGDVNAALREFDAYLARYPRGRVAQQALYWSGRAHAELGNTAAARTRMEETLAFDPMSWYAALAADRLGRRFPAPAPAASLPVTGMDAIIAVLEPVDLLRRLGWHESAAFEIERVRRRYRGNDAALYALAELLNERGYTNAGVSIGWDLQRRAGQWNDRLLRIVYPFPYRDLIESEAARRNVDPYLAAGLIRQESMFNATAVSPAGAVGLMQVMPETGRAIARQVGIERFTADMLRKPELNVYIGMAYLADQLRAYGDRTDAVLAAYNAGPHRVQRWQQFPEWRHGELFAERIPFAETRGYVKIVQANARLYRGLYAPAPAAGPAR